MNQMKVYTLESSYNSADTCRDPDDIHTKKLGVYSSLALAKAEAIKYKLDHFFRKDVDFYKHDGKMYLMDTCSWPTKLTITEEELQ
jgi:hypothetical protein